MRFFSGRGKVATKGAIAYCLALLLSLATSRSASGHKRSNITHFSHYDVEFSQEMAQFIYNTPAGSTSGQQSFADLLRVELITALQSQFYSVLSSARYDESDELEASGGPRANQELCLSQLRQLISRADALKRERFNSKDLNMVLLLDSFGRPPSGVITGDIVWLGSYEQCAELRIKFPDDQMSESNTRYCLSSMKLINWPTKSENDELISFKQAVCLPIACDSLDYKDKLVLVQKLADFNSREIDFGAYNLTDLFCLPDEESSLRQWWRSPGTVVFLSLLSGWLLIVVFATIKRRQLDGQPESARRSLSPALLYLYESLSIDCNLKKLFTTSSKPSSKAQTGKQGSETSSPSNQYQMVPTGNSNSAAAEAKQQQQQQQNRRQRNQKIVDLRCLEGVKVIFMVYIMLAHLIYCGTHLVRNQFQFVSKSYTFQILNSTPSFAVDVFLTITGILTSYFALKKARGQRAQSQQSKQTSSNNNNNNNNNSNNKSNNKNKNKSSSYFISGWIKPVVNRYLRFMPIYVFLTAYQKYIFKFTGSGPLWDYGTSILGPRRMCEQESWLWTLLYAANFKPSPLVHCLIPGWYLALDVQCVLLTPLLLAFAVKRPKLEKLFLYLSLVALMVVNSISLATSNFDLRRVSTLDSFTIRYLEIIASHTHMRLEWRIGAFLVGLLLGLYLHDYERKKLQWLLARQQALESENEIKQQQQQQQPVEMAPTTSSASQQVVVVVKDLGNSNSGNSSNEEEPNWPVWFRKSGLIISGAILAYAFGAPFLRRPIQFDRQTAAVDVGIAIATGHPMVSLAIGLYLILATTGQACPPLDRFLSRDFWRPLSRVGLIALLINPAISQYFGESSRQTFNLNLFTYTAMATPYVILIYTLAVLLHVLVDAPARAIIMPMAAKLGLV